MDKISYFCIENEQYSGTYNISRGWGNGYLVIPRGHILWGKDYEDINSDDDIYVHGGWTFSRYYREIDKIKNKIITDLDGIELKIKDDDWIIGFDTSHYNDDLNVWPKKRVFEHISEIAEHYSRVENLI